MGHHQEDNRRKEGELSMEEEYNEPCAAELADIEKQKGDPDDGE